MNKYFIENDMCEAEEVVGNMTNQIRTACSEWFDNEEKLQCPAAFEETARIGGIAQIAGLLFAPVFGVFADSIDVVAAMGITAAFAAVAYGLIGLDTTPGDAVSSVLAVLW